MARLPPPRTLYELAAWHASETPDHEAVVTATDRLTYDAWRTRAAQVGAALAAEGVGRGHSVALLADNRSAWLEIALGVSLVGARLVTLNTWAKTWDLEYMIGHASPRALFTVDHIGKQDFLEHLAGLLPELWDDPPGRWRSERFPDLHTVVVIGDDVPAGAERYADWTTPASPLETPASQEQPDDIAMVMFTSGSTARPKAVALVHRDLIENGFQIGERQRLTAEDRVFLASPLFWAYGGANAMMAALTHGSTLVLQSQFRAPEALDLLEAERCTSIYTLPALTHALLNETGFSAERLSSLRTGLTIGPPADIRLAAEKLGGAGICNIYGGTETYGNCCVTPTEAPLERRAHRQGPPLAGVELRIVHPETRALLPAGEVGEILVRGRITPGYLDEDGTPAPVVDEEGFYATGDLGQVDEDGWISFEGRLSEMIKTAGINVSPAEVEDFLITHPDVAEAAVAGGSHAIRGEQVVAFVCLTNDATITPEELREYCRHRIASYKVPAVIRTVDEFPLTDTGKLARRELTVWADGVVAETDPEAEAEGDGEEPREPGA